VWKRLSAPYRSGPSPDWLDDPLNKTTNQLKAGGISPVRVFEDHEYRVGLRKSLDLDNKGLPSSFPTLMRIKRQLRIAAVIQAGRGEGRPALRNEQEGPC
jgi:hypothetical protein